MKENRLRWFGHMRRRPTHASIRRIERINLRKLKECRGDRRKHEWR